MLERSNLVRLQDTFDVEIEWRGFQLHPEIPPGGADLGALFGRERAARMRDRVRTFGAELGVELSPPAHAPSTLKPLAVTEYARDHGALQAFRDATMDAYWRDGRDIEDDAALAALAAAAGLDATEAVSAGTDPAYVSRVEAMRHAASDELVTGIPTLFFPTPHGSFPVVGCQAWDTYERIADKLAIPRR